MGTEGNSPYSERFGYLDFEIEVSADSGREYIVKVIRSPAGEAIEKMRFPFDELALENRLKNREVNPEMAVTLGTAIQAGILEGLIKDLLLLEVTPLTLSIETLGGIATPVVSRNTTIPTRRSEIFSTAEDNQASVEVHVVQGDRPLASDNKSLPQKRP